MRDLPAGWAWATLDDLLLGIEAGKSPKCEPRQAGFDEWGVIKVSAMTYGEFRETENKALPAGTPFSRAHEIKPGDLLVSRANTEEYVGAPVLVKSCRPRLLLSDKSLRLKTPDVLSREWLFHVLSSPTVRRQISVRATGVKDSMRNISQQSLYGIKLPVPPAAEQRRIVDELDRLLGRLDHQCHALRICQTRLGHLATRLIHDRVTGMHQALLGGTSAPPPPSGVTDSLLPSIPRAWRWARLGDVASVVGGVTKDAKKQVAPQLVDVPYLRVANVQRGRLDLSDVATIRVPTEVVERLRLTPGDVLLNEGGDRDKLGRGWIWEGQLDICIHQNHVFRARVDQSVIDPRLVAWFANCYGKHWCEVNGKQSVNLASISLSKIRLLPVPVPPVEQQMQIIEAVEASELAVAKSREAITAATRRAATLRRSLLDAAFSGRLVPQDPDDEPAAVLLERIRAERAAMPKQRRGRRAPAKAATTTSEELPL